MTHVVAHVRHRRNGRKLNRAVRNLKAVREETQTQMQQLVDSTQREIAVANKSTQVWMKRYHELVLANPNVPRLLSMGFWARLVFAFKGRGHLLK